MRSSVCRPNTTSPGLNLVFAPALMTTPEKSQPRMHGRERGYNCCSAPVRSLQSVGFTPAACHGILCQRTRSMHKTPLQTKREPGCDTCTWMRSSPSRSSRGRLHSCTFSWWGEPYSCNATASIFAGALLK